ncbi:hypothetical protein G6F68_019057 [Rhizopus microsporus]|nr:hypothetical protein G6F68_019057 [Rhizopus microsporus]
MKSRDQNISAEIRTPAASRHSADPKPYLPYPSFGAIFGFDQTLLVDDLGAQLNALVADRERLLAGRIVSRDQLVDFVLRLIAK